jgi:surface glycoprotein (TIGR04207 family)
MTEETNIREKSRAVFLAALMVLSVFAMSASFAGTAAAVNQGDVSPDDDAALSTTTHNVSAVTGAAETNEDVQGIAIAYDSDVDLSNVDSDDITVEFGGSIVDLSNTFVADSANRVHAELSNSRGDPDTGTNIRVQIDNVVNPGSDIGLTLSTHDTTFDVDSASPGGEIDTTSATLDVARTAGSAEDFSIDVGTTVLSEPIDNEFIPAGINERATANFEDTIGPTLGQPTFGNLAGSSGLLGVPFQESPYSDLQGSGATSLGVAQQQYSGDITFQEGGGEFTIDHSNSLDAGVTVLDPADTSLPASTVVSFSAGSGDVTIGDINVNSEAGTITVSYDADSDVTSSFSGTAHLIPGDTTLGIAPQSESIDVDLDVSGDTESDSYRLVDTGNIGIEQDDLTDVTADGALQDLVDSSSFTGGTSNTA